MAAARQRVLKIARGLVGSTKPRTVARASFQPSVLFSSAPGKIGKLDDRYPLCNLYNGLEGNGYCV